MTKRKTTPTAPPARDFDAELRELDTELTRRTEQRATVTETLDRATVARDAAVAARQALALAALAEGDPDAQRQRRDALGAFTAAVAEVEDARTAADRLDAIIRELAERRRAVERGCRLAELDALGAEVVETLRGADMHLAALVGALREVQAVKRQMASLAAEHDLAQSQRRFDLRNIQRVLRVQLAGLVPLEGVVHHAFAGMTLADAEAALQGGGAAVADEDDDAAHTLMVTAEDLREVLAAESRPAVQH